MYFIDRPENARETQPEREKITRPLLGASEYDEALQSSFVFGAEKPGFYSVKAPKEKTGKPVPTRKNAPVAIL